MRSRREPRLQRDILYQSRTLESLSFRSSNSAIAAVQSAKDHRHALSWRSFLGVIWGICSLLFSCCLWSLFRDTLPNCLSFAPISLSWNLPLSGSRIRSCYLHQGRLGANTTCHHPGVSSPICRFLMAGKNDCNIHFPRRSAHARLDSTSDLSGLSCDASFHFSPWPIWYQESQGSIWTHLLQPVYTSTSRSYSAAPGKSAQPDPLSPESFRHDSATPFAWYCNQKHQDWEADTPADRLSDQRNWRNAVRLCRRCFLLRPAAAVEGALFFMFWCINLCLGLYWNWHVITRSNMYHSIFTLLRYNIFSYALYEQIGCHWQASIRRRNSPGRTSPPPLWWKRIWWHPNFQVFSRSRRSCGQGPLLIFSSSTARGFSFAVPVAIVFQIPCSLTHTASQ